MKGRVGRPSKNIQVHQMNLRIPTDLEIIFKKKCEDMNISYSDGFIFAVSRWIGESSEEIKQILSESLSSLSTMKSNLDSLIDEYQSMIDSYGNDLSESAKKVTENYIREGERNNLIRMQKSAEDDYGAMFRDMCKILQTGEVFDLSDYLTLYDYWQDKWKKEISDLKDRINDKWGNIL